MSQDPHSGYNPNPEHPYGTPPPQNPYETPSQTPYGVPPSPYQVPPGTYYGAPGQPPYNVPPGYNPNQSGSGQPPYGVPPGYSPNQSDYGYEASAPLPLSEAISQLPNQYIKVLTKPSAFTFATEIGKANWDIVWVQLLVGAVITSILGYLGVLTSNAFNMYGTSSPMYHVLSSMFLVTILGAFLGTIISFFIWQGIVYLLAKAFGGTGTFLRQGYASLLASVPIGIIAAALNLIPILGGVVAFGLWIYNIVLQIFSLMAVHRLSGGKAAAVFFLPLIILCVLAFIVGIIAFFAIFAAIRSNY